MLYIFIWFSMIFNCKNIGYIITYNNLLKHYVPNRQGNVFRKSFIEFIRKFMMIQYICIKTSCNVEGIIR